MKAIAETSEGVQIQVFTRRHYRITVIFLKCEHPIMVIQETVPTLRKYTPVLCWGSINTLPVYFLMVQQKRKHEADVVNVNN